MKKNSSLQNNNIVHSPSNNNQTHSVIITSYHQQLPTSQTTNNLPTPTDVLIKSINNFLLSKVYSQIQQNNLLRSLLHTYSTQFAHSYISENVSMYLSQRQLQNIIQKESQPVPIKIDNLCPISTSVEENLKTNDGVKSIPQTILSGLLKISRNMSIASKTSKNSTNYPLQRAQTDKKLTSNHVQPVQLDEKDLPQTIRQQTQDPHIQTLRKLKILKPKQQLQQKEVKKPVLKQKIKLQDKISYDFTGDILKIKQFQQNSTLFNGEIKTLLKQGISVKSYESFKDKTQKDLESLNLKKDRIKKNPTKRESEVEFSNILSLMPHMQIKEGSKFTHNKATLENKKKQPSLIEIKKSMSLNKISKSEFSRLKSVASDVRELNSKSTLSAAFPSIHMKEESKMAKNERIENEKKNLQEQTDKKSIKPDRLQIRSLSKYPENKKSRKLMNTERSCQKMYIQNQELTQIMLKNDTKIINAVSEIIKQQDLGNNNDLKNGNFQSLGPRDIANLHYIKTGGIIGALEFPKIPNKVSGEKYQQKKIKSILSSKQKTWTRRNEENLENLRRNFQEKLRV